MTKLSIIVLLFATVCIAQTVKPALPSKQADPTRVWPGATTVFTLSNPCGGYVGAELGKDGKCHSDVVLWPAGWTCEIPMNKPDSGKPTVLRCTWEPTK
jgi:hypothetical protein